MYRLRKKAGNFKWWGASIYCGRPHLHVA